MTIILLTLLSFPGLLVLIPESSRIAIPDGNRTSALPVTGETLPGTLGFSFIIRLNDVSACTTSKVAGAGILIGFVAFLLILSPGLPGIFRYTDLLQIAVILFPVVAFVFRPKNSYSELQYKRSATLIRQHSL